MMGKVKGALARYADQVYNALNEEEKRRVRHIFLQMVQPGDGTAGTRRITKRDELNAEDWMLVRRLSDQRLVVVSTTQNGQEIAEIAHEALIQNWQLLQDWMKMDGNFRAWQERLRSILRQWEENKSDVGGLLRGMPLAEAKRWLDERGQQLTDRERDFLFQQDASGAPRHSCGGGMRRSLFGAGARGYLHIFYSLTIPLKYGTLVL
jgi:hypothetical protein